MSNTMGRNANNQLLQKAKVSKSDEFYTLLPDIARELQHYTEQFRGKTVYCNCDDPGVSNFFRYFAANFQSLGLRKLIASCYKKSEANLFHQASADTGFFCEYTEANFAGGNASPIEIQHFNGDGDFRSEESIKLLKQSDIVVTNPPFSLFREFVAQLTRYEKKFLIIGNINAITYKEIFKLIQENRVWLGINLGRGISGFIVPEHYALYGSEARVDENGNRIVSSNNCLWLTNLDTELRHKEIELTKVYEGNEAEYPKYDNCNGINVSRTQDIPKDYGGIMGVPITFLHKFNPDQFEIIRFRKGDDGKDLSINGKCPYFRILIRNKQVQSCRT